MSAKKLAPGVDRLPSGKYRVRVHIGGNRYKSKSFTRQRDAERWREDMLSAKETGRVAQVDADLQPFWELAAEHMAAEGPNWSERTKSAYSSLWNAHVKTHDLRDMPLRAITPEVVENFRDDLRAAGVGDQSIRKLMTLCQSIHERAVRFGRAQSNPWKVVKKPKTTRAKTVKVIGPEGVEAVRARLKGQHSVYASVLAYSGLRPGEARALRWGDIGKQSIHVREGVNPDGSEKGTKTGRTRSVRLMEPLAEDLAAWRLDSGKPGDSAYVFPRADGKAWTESDYQNFRSRTFKKAAKDAGVDIGTPYDLRHSAASLWLHEGINPVQVAAWMGHSLAELSKTYAHVIGEVDPDDRTSAVDMIRNARSGRDMPVTWIGGKGSQSRGKRSAA
jgi:integrase